MSGQRLRESAGPTAKTTLGMSPPKGGPSAAPSLVLYSLLLAHGNCLVRGLINCLVRGLINCLVRGLINCLKRGLINCLVRGLGNCQLAGWNFLRVFLHSKLLFSSHHFICITTSCEHVI